MTGALSVWRIEWWRLVRTRRLLALAVVFAGLGFLEPLAARYMSQLVGSAGRKQRITIIAPPPVPADGITGYQNNAMLIGLIVAIVLAAFACAVDAAPALSVFYRTRARYRTLILPRVTVVALGAVGGYLIGLLCAYYETTVLIGRPPLGSVLYGALLAALYLVFAVSVTAVAATLVRSPLGTVGVTLVVLLLIPIIGQIPTLSDWLPSTLSSATISLLDHKSVDDHFLRAITATVALTAGSLTLACFRGSRREVA